MMKSSWCKALKTTINLKKSFCDCFYNNVSEERARKRADGLPYHIGDNSIVGFPLTMRAWCNSKLKTEVSLRPQLIDKNVKIVSYVGIAADEPERVNKHITKDDVVLPLVQIGWDEDLCGLEATYMDMLSPTYETYSRDGCWFCHNQSIDQLRNLYHTYPDLWAKLMKIDVDSPVSFKANGRTVHDYDKRFKLEDKGLIPIGKTFKWKMVDKYDDI